MSETIAPESTLSSSPLSSASVAHHAPGKSESDSSTSKPSTSELLRRQMAHCGEYTFQALNKIGVLSIEDSGRITQQYLKYLTTVEKDRPFADALAYLYFEGWRRPEIDAQDTILRLTKSLITYSRAKITHLSFAQHTNTPIEFYNSFPTISEICRLLNTPIIQLSEKEFFTVAGINPFTATAAARLISNEVQQEIGRKPFSFISTTDFTSVKYLHGRHFGT